MFSLCRSCAGALADIKNPIVVANGILNAQRVRKPCGLVPPSILVGAGAKSWAIENQQSSVADLKTGMLCVSVRLEELITVLPVRSQRVHSQYKRKLEDCAIEESAKTVRLDTVGAVAISRSGETASGVSSGGISLKTVGRIGQAAMFGAGCWATENVACTTSGVGEYIVRTLLARQLAVDLSEATATSGGLFADVFRESFRKTFSGNYCIEIDSID